jgi:prophage antirepressor-like protein
MSVMTPFNFDDKLVRIVMRNEEPWFVATDLASVLGYRDAPNMVRMLDDDEMGLHDVETHVEPGPTHSVSREPGQTYRRSMVIVSESGMYACVLRSKRPEAQRFRKWVTAELLPTLRKTGRFETRPDEAEFDGLAAPRTSAYLSAAAELLRISGRLHGRGDQARLWAMLGLPPFPLQGPGDSGQWEGVGQADALAKPLAALVDGAGDAGVTIEDCCLHLRMRYVPNDLTARHLGAVLRSIGCISRPERRSAGIVRVFRRRPLN